MRYKITTKRGYEFDGVEDDKVLILNGLTVKQYAKKETEYQKSLLTLL